MKESHTHPGVQIPIYGKVEQLYVDPAHRGKGSARALLDRFSEELA